MKELVRFFYYCIFFSLIIIVSGFFCEFIFWPFLAWIAGADGYHFPSIERLYKWLKLIGIVTWPCAIAMWVYEKE
ncbi:hypothetical protein [Cupriavidus sp. SK-3]|uniref:hypothetical protein n=1 Tax=Cupriavidus sp. SK-3 TaxID=1470558 RepID=UPI0012695695|nr:hypothetical protein [Cupriavidus sp. SK-3]